MSAGLAEAVDLRLRSERAGRTEDCLEVAFPAGRGEALHHHFAAWVGSVRDGPACTGGVTVATQRNAVL